MLLINFQVLIQILNYAFNYRTRSTVNPILFTTAPTGRLSRHELSAICSNVFCPQFVTISIHASVY